MQISGLLSGSPASSNEGFVFNGSIHVRMLITLCLVLGNLNNLVLGMLYACANNLSRHELAVLVSAIVV